MGGYDDQFDGPVEVDESYFGGKRENMSLAKRRELAEAGVGRGAVGKTAVVGIKDRETNEVRAEVIADTTGKTLQGFVREHTEAGATVLPTSTRAMSDWAATSSTRPSITRSASMWTARRTPTAWSPSGRC